MRQKSHYAPCVCVYLHQCLQYAMYCNVLSLGNAREQEFCCYPATIKKRFLSWLHFDSQGYSVKPLRASIEPCITDFIMHTS